MKTTLNQIREHSPCKSGWTKLLKTLNKTVADDKPLSILTILESNGLDDALWCLRAVTGRDREIRLFAVWCARQVEYLNPDPRVKECNNVTEKYANGEATKEELKVAADAAAAAYAAAYAVDAAYAAAVAADAAAADDMRFAQEQELIRVCNLCASCE